MSLFVEFHLIQNFAPSNLNRDDTGAPKDALFGGHRRARVSSQCFKRAIRLNSAEAATIPAKNQGVRTKKLKQLLEARLAEMGRTEAGDRIEAALAGAGLKLKDGKTEYLLFLGQGEIEAFTQLIDKHWDALATAPAPDAKKSKKEAKASLPAEVIKEAKALLNGQKAVDVAMFGRMLADMPGVNQDAACQVAHALSTHRVEREFDYFTAVDDRAELGEPQVEMISHNEFNSATFYRYAVIDANKLVENLQQDRELALTGIKAFTQAMARAIPTGKQNTFAAHNPPSFVGVVLRHASPFNLANAFEKPVWPKSDKELTTLSVDALAEHDTKVSGFYGDGKDDWAYLDMTGAWPGDKGKAQANLDALADWVQDKVRAELGA
jgi:CRISPR system Cascade subunit CasC